MSSNKAGGKIFMAGLLGAMAGAIGGLLFAPQSGKKTREEIAQMAKDISKQIKSSVEDTEDKVKEVFGNANKMAMDKYKEIKTMAVNKVAALKGAGEEIDRDKYMDIVDDVVSEFKEDLSATKNGAVKMANQMKKDWEKVKKALMNA
jgi:gas vesicle protein